MRGSGELGGIKAAAACFLMGLLIAYALLVLLPFVIDVEADVDAAFALDLVTRFAFCSIRNCAKKAEGSSCGGGWLEGAEAAGG